MKPGASTRIKEKMVDQGFDKHDGESRTGKYTQDKNDLANAIEFPARLEFFQPLRCGQLVWFI
jgi:hypothetical protein